MKETFHEMQQREIKEKHIKVSNASKFEKDLALAFGCIDYDRCNERVTPQGSCDDCIVRAMEVIKEMRNKGYRL